MKNKHYMFRLKMLGHHQS